VGERGGNEPLYPESASFDRLRDQLKRSLHCSKKYGSTRNLEDDGLIALLKSSSDFIIVAISLRWIK
jgi:hypothetical protein